MEWSLSAPGGGKSSRTIARWKSEAQNVEARRLKAAALNELGELGERQISAIARNYYLSAAQYLRRD